MSTNEPSWRELAAAGHAGDEPTARMALGSTDAARRELAVGALHRMQALTDADLAAAANDAHPAVRRRAATITAERPHAPLLGLLHDADPTVVEVAAWAAGERECSDDDVIARLVHLATEADDALVREAAVAALGATGDERGLPAILAGCTDKPAVRRRAVLALAPFDGPDVQAALDAALQDRDWQVRQSAEDIAPFVRGE
ncbi:MAG: HEAT repeat domain-containing protein [Actinomycetota bacterium]